MGGRASWSGTRFIGMWRASVICTWFHSYCSRTSSSRGGWSPASACCTCAGVISGTTNSSGSGSGVIGCSGCRLPAQALRTYSFTDCQSPTCILYYDAMMKTYHKFRLSTWNCRKFPADTVSALLIAKSKFWYLRFGRQCDRVLYTRVVADLTGWPSGDNPGTFLPFSRSTHLRFPSHSWLLTLPILTIASYSG